MKLMDGIDLDALNQTVSMVTEKPELAQFNFKTSNHWINGTHSQASVQTFYGAGREDTTRTMPLRFDEDEPPILLGNNQGANPVEYVLVGLSGCLTTSLVAQAAARGIRLKSVESNIEGDLDIRGFLGVAENVRNGFQNIRVNFKIDADAPEEVINELVQLAQQRSPVFDVITHGAPVSVAFQKV